MRRQIIVGIMFVFVLASCTSITPLPNPSTILEPTEILSPSLTPNTPTKPSSLIDERLNALFTSYRDLGNYPFTDEQIEKIKQSIELVQIQDEKPGISKSYWIISQAKLIELQEPELAEMLGYIPLAYSEDGNDWQKPGIKDVTNTPFELV